MKYIFCLTIIFSSTVLRAAGGGIVINEYYSGPTGTVGSTSMAGDDYIEFILTQNMTSASLAALTFGDTNSTTSAFGGVFQFDKSTLDSVLSSAGRTAFLAGTIIVVKGADAGSQDLAYNPTATNSTTDSAWNIQLVAGQGAKADTSYKSNGDISFSITGEAVWISTDNPPKNSTDTSSLISGLAHHSTSLGTVGLAIQSDFGASHIFSGSQPYGDSISNIGSDAATVLSLTVGGTIGTPNGGTNTTWIDGLRVAAFSAPEPSRVLMALLGVAACLFQRKRSPKTDLP